jgi:HEAT repeat protein
MCRWVLVGLVMVLWLWPGAPRAQAQEDEKVKKLIVQLLEDKDAKKRRLAVFDLEIVGARVKGVLQALSIALEKDPDAVVRRDIALVIGRMGDDGKDAIPALAYALKTDKDDKVREVSARALLQMVPHSRRALQQLVEALLDGHAATRAAAAETISALGDYSKTAVPQLTDFLKAAKDKKGDAIARMHVAIALGKCGADAKTATPVLVVVLGDDAEDVTVREAAAETLGKLGLNATDAGKPLAVVLADRKNALTLRLACAKALYRVEGETKHIWPSLKIALGDSDASLRLQTVRAATQYAQEEPEVIKILAKLARTDDNVEVRLASIQELGRLEGLARDAVKDLLYIIDHDEREAVRQQAEEALKKIKKN